MGEGWRLIFAGDQNYLIGQFDPKLTLPLFEYPTMARLFTAMAVGGLKKVLKTRGNHLGFVMSRLSVPGSEQPRLERDRSQMVSHRPGGG
jgi:hypothetical protein